MNTSLRRGMFGLTQIGGLTGFFIRTGQVLVGDASRWTHAFIVIDDQTILEAQPTGARLAPLSSVLDGRPIAASYAIRLTSEESARIADVSMKYVGVKYGFSAYLHLALTFVGIDSARLRKYLSTNRRLICSQLVDQIYHDAGIHLFDDGRAHYDVTPGDLANLLIEVDWSNRG